MKKTSIAFAAATLVAAPAFSQPTPVVPAPERDASGIYQVFRVTDNQLDCGQLISEMNYLNAAIKTQATTQAQAQNTNRAGRSIAGGALGGALGGFARGAIARNVPGMGIAGALAAQGATDAASAALGQAVANGGQQAAAAPAAASDETQRLQRVSQLFSAKGC